MRLDNAVQRPRLNSRWFNQDRVYHAVYGLALTVSISTWFIAVRAPLWLDETGSYGQIAKGFSGILSRQYDLTFPAYSYILWLSSQIIGTSEVALRVPSILAMLGAVYLLYLAARELFDQDIAIIVAVLFCLHPIVIFLSIDVRPYAFAMLTTNAAIYFLVRLRRDSSSRLAVLFGFSAAAIVWFHFLFIVILPALALSYFAVKNCDRRTLWRQFAVALAAFTAALLPVVPGFLTLFRTRESHVFEQAPNLLDLEVTFGYGHLLTPYALAGFVAFLALAFATWPRAKKAPKGWKILVCASLGLIPILILYGVSTETTIHMFIPRHRVIAIPGIALCWALVFSRFSSRPLRLLLCVVFVAMSTWQILSSPSSREHGYTWKYALDYAEENASLDGAPILICSDFPEADSVTMPVNSAKDSRHFAQLSYYRLTVPVVPMPRSLNSEAVRVGSQFLQQAAGKHERFLALAFRPSYGVIDWLAQNATTTYLVRNLGVFDGVEVVEFEPRIEPNPAR
ncbi:MAG: glycosyltransferase family 39 protein [Terracidiphilus sp.]|jgi:hypothetical protein